MNDNLINLLYEIKELLLELKNDKSNNIVYEKLKDKLDELDDKVDKRLVPNEIYVSVYLYSLKCRRYMEYLRLNIKSK